MSEYNPDWDFPYPETTTFNTDIIEPVSDFQSMDEFWAEFDYVDGEETHVNDPYGYVEGEWDDETWD